MIGYGNTVMVRRVGFKDDVAATLVDLYIVPMLR